MQDRTANKAHRSNQHDVIQHWLAPWYTECGRQSRPQPMAVITWIKCKGLAQRTVQPQRLFPNTKAVYNRPHNFDNSARHGVKTKGGSSNLSALIFHVLAVAWRIRRPSSWCVQKSPLCPTMNTHIFARLNRLCAEPTCL